MGEYNEAFVGIDPAKGRNAIAIADGERGGEVRYLGEVATRKSGAECTASTVPRPR